MFDAMSVQDLLAACGFALSFCVGVVSGLLT